MKNLLIKIIATVLYITGARFDKRHRVEESLAYRIVNTTECNQRAEYKKLGLKWE
jgi:hypothetical protein